MTGLLAKLLSGQIRLAGAHQCAAPVPTDRSNEGHLGHTLTWVRSDRCCAFNIVTDLAGRGRMVGRRQSVLDAVVETDPVKEHGGGLGLVFAGEDATIEFLSDVKSLFGLFYPFLGTSRSTERLATPLFDDSSLCSLFGVAPEPLRARCSASRRSRDPVPW